MKNYTIAVAGTGYVGLSIATLLSVIPECHIASKDYCIKGTGGKEA